MTFWSKECINTIRFKSVQKSKMTVNMSKMVEMWHTNGCNPMCETLGYIVGQSVEQTIVQIVGQIVDNIV